MNTQLKNLYNQYWNKLKENAKNTSAAHPLLLKVSEEYENADMKIMIIGQETDGWNGLLEEKDRTIDFLMDDYYHYLYSIYADKNDLPKRLNKKKTRPFWNRSNFKFYDEELKRIFKDKSVSLLWNNVSKIGKCGRGKPTNVIENLEKNYFSKVFEKELEILKPNIIIFVTGNRKIPVAHKAIQKIKENQVSEISFDKFPNIIAIRTYHPNAKIKGGKKHLKKEVINLIANKLNV